MRRDEALAILHDHAHELRDMGVVTLALFGSVARDQARPDSDVDLLATFSESVGLFEMVDIQQRLEELLGRPVDLIPRRQLKRRIRKRVLAEAIRAA